MSVILGETPKRQPRVSALKAHDDVGELAASLPLSITLWVFFDQAPGPSETHTLFWYGDSPANHLVLEATENTGAGGVDITAKLQGSTGSVSVTATALPTAEWMMLTVIVAEEGGASHRVTLYVNDGHAGSSPANVGTVSPAAYESFVLGAAEGGSNFGRFRAEHVAVWKPDNGNPLSPNNIEELYEERWAPFEYEEGPTPPLGRLPGIAYWMLVGHWSAGIEAADNQSAPNQGMLWNQANPEDETDKPPLQMLDDEKPVVWSAKTPVMRYKTPEQSMAPGPVIHPPIPPVSRLQPHFYVYYTRDFGTHKYGPLEIPPFTHPNFVPKLAGSAESALSIPLYVTAGPADYLPVSDTALLARHVADWFEFCGLALGVGSVGDGLYEGYGFLRAIGLGNFGRSPELRGLRGTLVTPEDDFDGANSAVPLELHPLDLVEPSDPFDADRPWHTWFNAHGKRLVKDYMDGFWTALKRELDERDLCYPRVLWFDMETWAQENYAVRPTNNGTFTLQRNDARATTEALVTGGSVSTLADIYTTGPTYDDTEGVAQPVNQPFLSWYLGWSVAVTQQAMLEAMMEKAKEVFPLTVWSNYDRFSADNPSFSYSGNSFHRLYNTPPASQATVHGDYSSPKLFTQDDLYLRVNHNKRKPKALGVTFAQVLRNLQKSRIDACVNAFTAKPLAPHFESGIMRWKADDANPTVHYYDLRPEDSFDILTYAWKRGVTDFIPFVFEHQTVGKKDGPDDYESSATEDEQKEAHDRMYDVCFRLLNTVQWLPQENHARVCRVSRRGW